MFHKTRFDIIDSMKEELYCEVISYFDLLETLSLGNLTNMS